MRLESLVALSSFASNHLRHSTTTTKYLYHKKKMARKKSPAYRLSRVSDLAFMTLGCNLL